jgi:hypothetical protein
LHYSPTSGCTKQAGAVSPKKAALSCAMLLRQVAQGFVLFAGFGQSDSRAYAQRVNRQAKD